MLRFLITASVIFALNILTLAQPELDIKPDKIEFEDLFNRLENVYFINDGDQVLVIDTIYYRSDLYHIRFDEYWHYPISINPGDTMKMDCILSGYFQVSSADTADTMFVISNSDDGVEEIRVRIDFFDDSNDAVISGQITDGVNPAAFADVYFLFEGTYIISSTVADEAGYYSAELPEGRYTVAAAKDSFYTTFYDQKSDPFNAKIITLAENTNLNVNIVLDRVAYTGNIITGSIYDSLSVVTLKRAIVVIRKGNHNPRKLNAQSLNDDDAYTVFTKSDGTFHAEIAEQDYYFAQSFSDYYVPAYYKSENTSSVFWQQADSIFISSYVPNKNIYLPRDSSFGGGIIEGQIVLQGASEDSLNDILVFAQSAVNDYLYGYTFSRDGGEFRLINLPFGQYKLFVQKIGYENFYSEFVEISTLSPSVDNIQIYISTSDAGSENFIPEKIELYQNYPNPFNPSTTISFSVPSAVNAKLVLMNILGEKIRLLYEGFLQRGKYSYNLDADDLSSGTYFIALEAENKIFVRKILLIK